MSTNGAYGITSCAGITSEQDANDIWRNDVISGHIRSIDEHLKVIGRHFRCFQIVSHHMQSFPVTSGRHDVIYGQYTTFYGDMTSFPAVMTSLPLATSDMTSFPVVMTSLPVVMTSLPVTASDMTSLPVLMTSLPAILRHFRLWWRHVRSAQVSMTSLPVVRNDMTSFPAVMTSLPAATSDMTSLSYMLTSRTVTSSVDDVTSGWRNKS